ncbi:endonuclease domain-containing protein [Roseibium sp.]|uniref:endonuclease domain-containing protein n=1 Tax=Roseibium sp. TaxID=1936156 RepID=UPI003D0B74D4
MAPSRIDAKTRETAKRLRLDQTKGEKLLWRALRELKTDGIHVRRQAPIGPYVADFVIFSRKLVVEIDGDVHGLPEQQEHDRLRDDWLRSQGFDVLRYSALDVEENLEGVVLDIRRKLGLA